MNVPDVHVMSVAWGIICRLVSDSLATSRRGRHPRTLGQDGIDPRKGPGKVRLFGTPGFLQHVILRDI